VAKETVTASWSQAHFEFCGASPGKNQLLALSFLLVPREARELNHAIQIISQQPGVKCGPFEIRPAADLDEMMNESEQRRRRDTPR
jgi:hypothetical protein